MRSTTNVGIKEIRSLSHPLNEVVVQRNVGNISQFQTSRLVEKVTFAHFSNNSIIPVKVATHKILQWVLEPYGLAIHIVTTGGRGTTRRNIGRIAHVALVRRQWRPWRPTSVTTAAIGHLSEEHVITIIVPCRRGDHLIHALADSRQKWTQYSRISDRRRARTDLHWYLTTQGQAQKDHEGIDSVWRQRATPAKLQPSKIVDDVMGIIQHDRRGCQDQQIMIFECSPKRMGHWLPAEQGTTELQNIYVIPTHHQQTLMWTQVKFSSTVAPPIIETVNQIEVMEWNAKQD